MSGPVQETHPDKPEDLGFDLPAAGNTSKVGIVVAIAVLAGGAFAIKFLTGKNAHGGDTAIAHGDGT
ncbi:MAG TPA: hypothetical protein VGC41_06025, partial [Kofleriaceae bacterium]